ncbi:amidohydrolase family protein [Ruegeria hyattellae]|uniref:amidohydrolase family protein n=1 Tax=Ruegeria hyattellae TaxID=3233337 RepID=UPI00355B0090
MLIDSHAHIWDPAKPGGVPFPPPESPIHRVIATADIRRHLDTCKLTAAILVEASERHVDNLWCLEQIADCDFIPAYVANLNPMSTEFNAQLDALTGYPKLRAIRPRLHPWEQASLAGFLPRFGRLAELGLMIENRMESALIPLADALPTLQIVVTHCGHVDTDQSPLPPRQVELVRTLAARKNIVFKFSGLMDLCTQKRPATCDPDYYAALTDLLWDELGPERLMFGSDWPVLEESERNYADAFDLAYSLINSRGGASAIDAVFGDTAEHLYRL